MSWMSDRIVFEGNAEDLRNDADVREFCLGLNLEGELNSYRNIKQHRRRKRSLGGEIEATALPLSSEEFRLALFLKGHEAFFQIMAEGVQFARDQFLPQRHVNRLFQPVVHKCFHSS